MPWGALAAAVVGAGASMSSASKGAKAQEQASEAAIAEQRRQYDQTRSDQLPWLNAGGGALAQMMKLNSGDFSQFRQSPDYKWALEQGGEARASSAASRGMLFSGAHQKDMEAYGQGMASQQYNNFYNKLQSMAGQGQTTASGLGGLGQLMAGNIGNAYQNNANARSSSYGQQANAIGGLAAAGGNAFGQWYGNNQANNPGGTGWYLGNNPGRG